MPVTESSILKRAGQWLLHSGIQAPNGGVARYYRTDLEANLPLSTEITAYALDGYLLLFEQSGDEEYLDAARKAAHFLTEIAWDAESRTMPFEVEGAQRYSYFFDCGIIARSLLWLWRVDGQEKNLDVASGIGISMERDFRGLDSFHPIVKLPCKEPLPYEIWWSRMPGASQLKSAAAWLDLTQETGESRFADFYEELLQFSLRRYNETLDNEQDRPKLMDRLHPWAYFLEGLQAVKERAEVKAILGPALARGEQLFEELAAGFIRADACAQLLRLRLLEGGKATAGQLARLEAFQYNSEDRRLDGGFCFGRRDGVTTPHATPVSTVFAMQAFEMAQASSLAGFDWRKLF